MIDDVYKEYVERIVEYGAKSEKVRIALSRAIKAFENNRRNALGMFPHSIELAKEGKKPPVDFKDMVLFHCGPVMRKDDDGEWHVVAAGPTTSSRMNSLEPEFIERFGVRAIIGKGGMSEPTVEAMKKLRPAVFEKLVCYLKYENVPRTNNHVEGVNRQFRKLQKVCYKRRRKDTIRAALNLLLIYRLRKHPLYDESYGPAIALPRRWAAS